MRVLWHFLGMALLVVSFCANADIFKCVVSGKTVYQDHECDYLNKKLNINPNQNIMSAIPNRSASRHSNQGDSNDPKCVVLLDRLDNTPLDTSSIGNMIATKAARKEIMKEYELRCKSGASMQSSIQSQQSSAESASQILRNIKSQQQDEAIRQLQYEQQNRRMQQIMGK